MCSLLFVFVLLPLAFCFVAALAVKLASAHLIYGMCRAVSAGTHKFISLRVVVSTKKDVLSTRSVNKSVRDKAAGDYGDWNQARECTQMLEHMYDRYIFG